MYKFNEGKNLFELIDTLNVVTSGNDLVEIFGANERLFILERSTYYDHNSPQYYISVNKYSTHNDTLTFLSKVFSYSSGVGLIDEIECTDSLIRYNSSYTYLNSSAYLTEPNGYFSSSAPAGLSGNKIYCISRDVFHLYYSTKIYENNIYSAEYIYNPTSVNEISNVKNFNLNQNYPNPFNPSTKIQYEIPKSGLVTIKVYDELGREIKTLVDQYKNKGSYEINFTAVNLSSGVYFYQLRAGNFVSTKKMILLK
jgi:hypothetical protein